MIILIMIIKILGIMIIIFTLHFIEHFKEYSL